MKKFAVVTSVAAIALIGGTALANHHDGGNWEEKFEKVDTNSDGKISMNEWNAHGKVWFDKIDANKDGSITKAEKEAFTEMKHEKRTDKSGDNRTVNEGKLSSEAVKNSGKDEDGQKAVER